MRMASRRSFSASSTYSHWVPTRNWRLGIWPPKSCRLSAVGSRAPLPRSSGGCATRQPRAESREPLSLKCKAHLLLLAGSHLHLLLLRAVLLVPRDERVAARREVGDREVSVRLRDAVPRVWEHGHVRLHPPMDVALDAERLHLDLVELLRRNHALNRLAFVELAIGLRHRMHVVQRVVTVLDVERLTHLHGRHMREVLAALLVEERRGSVRRRCRCIFHVHQNIRELATGTENDLFVLH